MISACVLVRSTHGRFEESVNLLSQVKGVQRVFPVLGRYDAVVDVEGSNFFEIGKTVKKMGRLAGVVFTETLVELLNNQGDN